MMIRQFSLVLAMVCVCSSGKVRFQPCDDAPEPLSVEIAQCSTPDCVLESKNYTLSFEFETAYDLRRAFIPVVPSPYIIDLCGKHMSCPQDKGQFIPVSRVNFHAGRLPGSTTQDVFLVYNQDNEKVLCFQIPKKR
ncbi:uncharacterized protein LOC141856330 [Brevipalpus obovatus]|uniref:uncharacterized protein LOC141856330 n=1 Tax=Brevipalpus obovatus TaxID=246614 RepID=UPI003D9E405E